MSSWDDTPDAGAADDLASDNVTYHAGQDVDFATAGDGGPGGSMTCRNCGAEGHMSRDCAEPKKLTGECYNCGEVGHNKSDCTNPKVDRPFTGTCRECGEEGHRASDCPSKVAEPCRNCGDESHKAANCDKPRQRDFSDIPELSEAEAMKMLAQAAAGRDTDLFKTGVKVLVKGDPELTYLAIEEKLRAAKLNLYLVGLLRNEPKNKTNVDLQGRSDLKYSVGYCFSPKPLRNFHKNSYPRNPEENLERLKNAGDTMTSLVPVCIRCGKQGHTFKSCALPAPEKAEQTRNCFNCGGTTHYFRDCPEPRVDKFACRNCGGSGHRATECTEPRSAAGVECRKCGEVGHFSRDCPSGGGGGFACRNCGEEGHKAAECEKPRDPSTMTCRNCDEKGHMSRECPKPRDYSRVQCKQCGEFGHTVVRCKKEITADGDGGFGDGGFGDGSIDAPAADADGAKQWDTGDAANDNSGGDGW